MVVMQPVVSAWAAEKGDTPSDDPGTDGPAEVDELMERESKSAWAPERKP
jgi:hypothetical protein